jgi:hypothetical protein
MRRIVIVLVLGTLLPLAGYARVAAARAGAAIENDRKHVTEVMKLTAIIKNLAAAAPCGDELEASLRNTAGYLLRIRQVQLAQLQEKDMNDVDQLNYNSQIAEDALTKDAQTCADAMQ